MSETYSIYMFIVMLLLCPCISFVRGFTKSLKSVQKKRYYTSKIINFIDKYVGVLPEKFGFLCKKNIFKHIFSAQLMIHSLKNG